MEDIETCDLFDALAAEFDVPVLSRIPLDPAIGDARIDTGRRPSTA